MARTNFVDKIADLLSGQKAAASALTDTIESQRAHLRNLRLERTGVQQAPVDQAEVRARIAAFLDAEEETARRFHFNGGFFARAEFTLKAAHDVVAGASRIMVPGIGQAGPSLLTINPPGSMLGLICILGQRKEVEARLVADELAAIGDRGLSAADREHALAEIEAGILQTEILIEKMIRAAEDAGMTIARDEDARPEIYLAKEL